MSVERDSYCIPSRNGVGRYTLLKSEFLSFAYYIEDSTNARNILKDLRAEYYDATHVCYAWILGIKGEEKMAADAGEPAHTAGTPILNVIRASELTYVLVAVVRYYGGTKLGVPGLIAAYSEAAKLALDDAGRLEKQSGFLIQIAFMYDSTSVVEKIIHRFSGRIINKAYSDNCRLDIAFLEKSRTAVLSEFNQFPERINIEFIEDFSL